MGRACKDILILYSKKSLQEKAVEATKQNEITQYIIDVMALRRSTKVVAWGRNKTKKRHMKKQGPYLYIPSRDSFISKNPTRHADVPKRTKTY
jgi:hypothetical protein